MIRRYFSARAMDYMCAPTVEARDPGTGFETKSPFTIIWLFAAIVIGVLLLATFSLGSLSAARAYVGGESKWSKAQKRAVFRLSPDVFMNTSTSVLCLSPD